MPLTFATSNSQPARRPTQRKPLYALPWDDEREKGCTPLVCGRCLVKRGERVRLGTVDDQVSVPRRVQERIGIYLEPGFAQRPDGVWELAQRAREKIRFGHAVDEQGHVGGKRVGPMVREFPAQVRCPASECGAINVFDPRSLFGAP